MAEPSTKMPHVAILLESPYSTHSQILHGILRFTQLHTPWTLDVRMGRAGEPTSFDPARWNFDGLIANRMPQDLAALVRRHHTPVVTVNDIWPRGRPLARIVCDNAPIAHMAAAYFLGCGFANFAFVGERSGSRWSVARERVFSSEIKQHGFKCHVYRTERDEGPADNRRLREWLADLPRPTALFAAYDIRARQVLDACREAGLAVPDDISILSVDNDEILCETASPPLSSISMSTEEAGYKAAELLDRAMATGLRPRGTSLIRYTGLKLSARGSTARDLKRDELVRRCREMMEANFGRKFYVADLVSRLNVSRRTLETHFRAATGRTLNAEITSLRIRHAQKLLSQSQMTQTQIAAACGFTDASHMCVVFRRTLGKLPSVFRA